MRSLCAALFFPLFAFCQTPDASLKKLVEGNLRYTTDTLEHPSRSSDRREEVSLKQRPFAIILSCSDSRVAPEIVFDQGIGDLFIVRVAGNVAGPIELSSIEFAALNYGASLIVVMGHESCGAVSAVFEGNSRPIQEIAELIQPEIKGAKDVEEAVKDNVQGVVAQLKKTKSLQNLQSEGKLQIVGAYYHLGSGQVDLLSD
jgi:carbonic anhydrase